MKKVISCKPAPEIELDIDGGDSVLLRFDVNALIFLSEIDGGLEGLFKKTMPEMVATLIHAGAHSNNENFTLEDARKIVCCMSVPDITMLIDEFSTSMGVKKNELNEELAKNLMTQFLTQASK